ncbi:MAG: hypothetical protein ACO3JL_21270, partial [Myxococcota bacterium]
VSRRGRRERLPLSLNESLFSALRQWLGASVEESFPLDGHRGTVLLTTEGGVLFALVKRPVHDVLLAALVEETLLSADEAHQLVAAILTGHSVFITGPAREAARRLSIALARALSEHAVVMNLDDNLFVPWALPAPLPGATSLERAHAAARIGVETVLSTSMSPEEALLFHDAALASVVIARVDVATPAALMNASSESEFAARSSFAAQVVQVGRGPSGRPRAHVVKAAPAATSWPALAPTLDPASPLPAQAAAAVTTRSPSPGSLQTVGVPAFGQLRAGLGRTPVVDVDELPPLAPLPAAPPSAWASTDHDDGPGWELGDPDATPSDRTEGGLATTSTFGTVLSEVRARPNFVPRPPAPHPQTRALRTDPFGGLSLEPPGGTLDDVPPLTPSDDEPAS